MKWPQNIHTAVVDLNVAWENAYHLGKGFKPTWLFHIAKINTF